MVRRDFHSATAGEVSSRESLIKMVLNTRAAPLSAPTGSAERQVAKRIFAWVSGNPVLPTLIFLFSLSYLLAFRTYSSLEPDEGIVLQGAERILRGQVPYRDFFSFYTPGSFYLLASLFRVFGDSFSLARTSIAVAGAICSVITYLLAIRVCPPRVALLAAVLATTAGAAFRLLVLHNVYSTVLACATVYASIRLIESSKTAWAFAAGSFATLTFLCEQSKGAGLCLGIGLGLLVLQLAPLRQLRRFEILALLVGLAWPLALIFAYFGALHSTKIMLDAWLWPLGHYTQANHVPFGYQNWSEHLRALIFTTGPVWVRALKILTVSPDFVLPVLPLVAVGLLLYFIATARRRPVPVRQRSYYVLMCSAFSGLLLSVVIVRPDILHFVYLAPLWYVVLAWILGARGPFSRILQALRPALTIYVCVAFGFLSLALLLTVTGARLSVDTRRGPIKTREKDTVINYIQAHLGRAQKLLVYPYLPLYNYLTATLSPSPYDYFQPGMNTPEQAREIILALESEKQTAILLEPWFAEKIANSWPNTSPSAIANDSVADYIVRNYRICGMLYSPDGWRFHYMVRKEASCS
jgi:hypothetical protein